MTRRKGLFPNGFQAATSDSKNMLLWEPRSKTPPTHQARLGPPKEGAATQHKIFGPGTPEFNYLAVCGQRARVQGGAHHNAGNEHNGNNNKTKRYNICTKCAEVSDLSQETLAESHNTP